MSFILFVLVFYFGFALFFIYFRSNFAKTRVSVCVCGAQLFYFAAFAPHF